MLSPAREQWAVEPPHGPQPQWTPQLRWRPGNLLLERMEKIFALELKILTAEKLKYVFVGNSPRTSL